MTVATAGLEDDRLAQRPRAARRILIEGALLGILADAAIRNLPDGPGWTLWVLALALAAANVARRQGLTVTREQIAWLALAVLCAGAFAWRDADELRPLNILGTLVALAMFSMAAARSPAPSIFAARVRDVITAGVYTVRDIVAGTPMLVVQDAEPHTLPAFRGERSWTALRALLITVPLVFVFIALLSRADPVFASLFQLPDIDVERVMEHVLLAGAFAWWSAGYIRGALLGTSRRPRLPDRMPVQLGIVDVTMALGAVIAVFTIFVALQLRWLFGGADVVLATTGLTVAEYARRGFFELVAVAALVLPLILGTRALIEDETLLRRHRQMSLVLIVLLGAIMASALLRMQLYVAHFGLTTDRLYASAFMGWLGVVFLTMALTVLRGWTRPFAAVSLLAGFATLMILNVMNPDALVARVNLARPAGARGIDYEYLSRLNGDAMPVVARALKSAPPSPASCRSAIGLRQRWVTRVHDSWNLGVRRGRAAVHEHLTPTDVQRLCEGITAAPATGGPTAAPPTGVPLTGLMPR